jgi:hypothetical protein
MLKSAVVAMTILGCNCEQNTCEYIRTAELDLTSIADCQARMQGEIKRTNAEYPLIVAVCENAPQQAATVASVAPETGTPPVFDTQPAAEPTDRSMMVRAQEGYSAIVSTTRDGLGSAAKIVTVPAGWIGRQIATVEKLSW